MIKEVFGGVSLVLSVAAYAPYLWSIFRRRTRPHLFSWIVWTIATGIVFVAQVTKGAGPGAWMTGFTLATNFAIAVMAVRLGEKGITRSDWVSFILALAAVPFWYFTDNPLGAVIISCLINLLAVWPTLRKSAVDPAGESMVFWAIVTIRSVVGVMALANYSATVILYPIINGVADAAVLCLLLMPSVIRVGHSKNNT